MSFTAKVSVPSCWVALLSGGGTYLAMVRRCLALSLLIVCCLVSRSRRLQADDAGTRYSACVGVGGVCASGDRRPRRVDRWPGRETREPTQKSTCSRGRCQPGAARQQRFLFSLRPLLLVLSPGVIGSGRPGAQDGVSERCGEPSAIGHLTPFAHPSSPWLASRTTMAP